MPNIKVAGNPKLIYISPKLLERIVKGKLDGDQSHLVDVKGYGFVELAQIKQILPDEPGKLAEGEQQEEKQRLRRTQEIAYEREIAAYRVQTPKEKAKRTARTWGLLLWTVRGNWEQISPVPIYTSRENYVPYGSRPSQELENRLVERMIPYFEENPGEWTCTSDIYQDLIGYKSKKRHLSKV